MSYAAACIGLFIFILAYFTLNAPPADPNAPITSPPPPDTSELFAGYCQKVDEATAPTFTAPADNILKVGDDDIDYSAGKISTEPSHCGGNRNQIGKNTTYRLVRKNVPMTANETKNDKGFLWDDSSCHFRRAELLNADISGIDSSKFTAFYPQISGEISLSQMMYSRSRNNESSYMYFIDYGLIFLLHRNADGSFVELAGTTMDGSREQFYIADVYQDIESGRPQVPDEALTCDTSITSATAPVTGPQVIEPENQATAAARDQLQLKYFVFGTASTGTQGQIVNGWGVHCKPAIYLYPNQKQLVNVKVYPSGFLTYTDPPYDNDKGWTVKAFPDGQLLTINDKRITNNYLYFESKIRDEVIQKPTKGWVVEGTSIRPPMASLAFGGGQVSREMEDLFKKILPELGLNGKQTSDFIEYWKKALEKDPSPYYFIGVIDQANVNQIERLEITPKPDSVNRVRIYFERLNEPKQVAPPDLSKFASWNLDLGSSTFRVVEWGGMVKNDPNHPFTCSQ